MRQSRRLFSFVSLFVVALVAAAVTFGQTMPPSGAGTTGAHGSAATPQPGGIVKLVNRGYVKIPHNSALFRLEISFKCETREFDGIVPYWDNLTLALGSRGEFQAARPWEIKDAPVVFRFNPRNKKIYLQSADATGASTPIAECDFDFGAEASQVSVVVIYNADKRLKLWAVQGAVPPDTSSPPNMNNGFDLRSGYAVAYNREPVSSFSFTTWLYKLVVTSLV